MSASVYSIEHPTARKEHVCCECGGAIKPGEKYQLFKGIWDGEAARFKTCTDCEALRREVTGRGEEFIFGELYGHCDYHGPARILQFIAIRRKRGKMTATLEEIEQRLKNETDTI